METLQEKLAYHNELFAETVSNFEKMFDAGQIDEDEYNQLVLGARDELQSRIDDELGLDTDEEDDEVEYSDNGDYAEFSVDSSYGAALLELGEAAGYDDIEQWCVDLAQATGYDANDIFAVITGEIEPSDELSLDVSEVLDLDDDTQAALLVYGIEARGEDINDYLEDEEEDEDNDDEDEDEEDEVEYSRVAALENQIAEFKASGIVKDELTTLEQRAWALVDDGRVPPVVVEKLLGNFNTDSDRMAAFSTVCHRNSVNAATELYAMNKVLSVLESMPVIANFGFEALQEVSDEEMAEEQTLDELATNYIKYYNSTRTR